MNCFCCSKEARASGVADLSQCFGPMDAFQTETGIDGALSTYAYDGTNKCVTCAGSGVLTQDRLPTSDVDHSGASLVPTSNIYQTVDDPIGSPDDGTTQLQFYNNGSGAGYALFGFTPFTVPAGATITKLSIIFRCYTEQAADPANWATAREYIKVNGTGYFIGSPQYGNNWTTHTTDFTTNPDTSAAWTIDDINGTGAHPTGVWRISWFSYGHSQCLCYSSLRYC